MVFVKQFVPTMLIISAAFRGHRILSKPLVKSLVEERRFKVKVISIVVGCLGTSTPNLLKFLKELPGKHPMAPLL